MESKTLLWVDFPSVSRSFSRNATVVVTTYREGSWGGAKQVEVSNGRSNTHKFYVVRWVSVAAADGDADCAWR